MEMNDPPRWKLFYRFESVRVFHPLGSGIFRSSRRFHRSHSVPGWFRGRTAQAVLILERKGAAQPEIRACHLYPPFPIGPPVIGPQVEAAVIGPQRCIDAVRQNQGLVCQDPRKGRPRLNRDLTTGVLNSGLFL